jgi:hypothetical protein
MSGHAFHGELISELKCISETTFSVAQNLSSDFFLFDVQKKI